MHKILGFEMNDLEWTDAKMIRMAGIVAILIYLNVYVGGVAILIATNVYSSRHVLDDFIKYLLAFTVAPIFLICFLAFTALINQ